MTNRYGDEGDWGIILISGGHGRTFNEHGTPPPSFSVLLIPSRSWCG